MTVKTRTTCCHRAKSYRPSSTVFKVVRRQPLKRLALILFFFLAPPCSILPPALLSTKGACSLTGICMAAGSDGSFPSLFTAEAPPPKHGVQPEPSGEREMDFRSSPSSAPVSFGSQRVLESCWSEEELKGRIPRGLDDGLRDAAKSGPAGVGIPPVSLPAVPPTCGYPSAPCSRSRNRRWLH